MHMTVHFEQVHVSTVSDRTPPCQSSALEEISKPALRDIDRNDISISQPLSIPQGDNEHDPKSLS